jgi:hypothetical protein
MFGVTTCEPFSASLPESSAYHLQIAQQSRAAQDVGDMTDAIRETMHCCFMHDITPRGV